MSRSRAIGGLGAVCAALVLGGCGLGAGSTPNEPVALSVTRDFGATSLVDSAGARVSGSDTVMRVTERNATVKTRYGGKFVQSINGLGGGRRDGRPVDWFVYVNGILTDKGATAVDVHGGDRIWWDNHDWGTTPDIRAVVGSYPEPFLHGSGGKRLPVRVECVAPGSPSCKAVASKLLKFGVPIGQSNISTSDADESLRILVGPWNGIRGRDLESTAMDSGPKASGVFAVFDKAGNALSVLNARGAVARTLGAGTGLIAATRATSRQPVWFVTGTDDAGVASAVRALDVSVLSNQFALAISHDLPVPVPARGGQAAAP
ncbi:MAG TPA: DUF4430 domain-containing protein [Solirubrobacteraceae bacterium]|jgi:hypothetical protein|nr:DUF4430 domain-containing protein [Solirubrobacteraceae bacterium]